MEMKKVLLSRAEEEAGVGGREARVDGGDGNKHNNRAVSAAEKTVQPRRMQPVLLPRRCC
jgi:hypothetical protein